MIAQISHVFSNLSYNFVAPGGPWNVAISNFFGYLSILCWIVVFLPQLYENYQTKSAASLSFSFILFWSLGDVFNLLGAVYQKLLFTAILLPSYFIVADIVLLGQIAYYKRQDKLKTKLTNNKEDGLPVEGVSGLPIDENTALNGDLTGQRSDSNNYQTIETNLHTHSSNSIGTKLIYLVFITLFLIGLVDIFNKDLTFKTTQQSDEIVPWAQACGWISTFLFCYAKVPQIIHNYRRKSTEGLSMLMFFFCCMGNLTYILSILIFSHEPSYIYKNLPWLFGAALPFLFDFVIFGQYFAYRSNST